MSKLYYTAPEEKQFNELKEKAIEIWKTYDIEGLENEKVRRIKKMQNIEDNFMYICAMFDISNQRKLAMKLSDETRKAVSDRIIDGGTPDEYNVFK